MMNFVYKLLILTTTALFIVWLVGLYMFSKHVTQITAPPSSMETDAIVVLTGSAGRVNTGLDLLQDGSTQQLFISGVDPRVDVKTLVDLWKDTQPQTIDESSPVALPCCIVLGADAKNTKENAAESAFWIASMDKQIASIRLVTADYHMPRAIMEFHHTLPETKILPHPVKAKHDRFLTFKEYNKTLLGFILYQIRDNLSAS